VRHFQDVIDPRTLFSSAATIKTSLELLDQYKVGHSHFSFDENIISYENIYILCRMEQNPKVLMLNASGRRKK